ncbi:hypothetical protein F5144DRAFT_214434 [Chaetomium tenue]|uniref:Uncharacterized protein n=1 Tax=Chaetomium tenue TaxID=1854479 RepID=A0ACB7P814_9PEZI|nr:hypothetical protein F5144DRAFT_214434 [Chaetomium globosum]
MPNEQYRDAAQEVYRFLEASWRGAIRVGQATVRVSRTTIRTARRLHAVLTETHGATDDLAGWEVVLLTSLQEAGRLGRVALYRAHQIRLALAQNPPQPTDERWEVISEGDATSSVGDAAELDDRWDDNGALFDDEPLSGTYTLADLLSDSDSDAGDGHPSSGSSSSSSLLPLLNGPSWSLPAPQASARRGASRHSSAAGAARPPAAPEPAPHAPHPHGHQSDDPGTSSTAHSQPPAPTAARQTSPPPATRPPPPSQQSAPRQTPPPAAPTASAITDDDAAPAARPPSDSRAPDDGTVAPAPTSGQSSGAPSIRDMLVPARIREARPREGTGAGAEAGIQSCARSGSGSGSGAEQTPRPAPTPAPAWTPEAGYDRVDDEVRARIADVVRRARSGGGE